MIEDKKILASLLGLPAAERLKIARILIDSAVESPQQGDHRGNGLLSMAGRYAGGPGNTADRDETILETEVDTLRGLSVR
jgi:hypothetical protein